jgi:hypothetical protein
MVFIEGAARLMQEFDLGKLDDNQAGLNSLFVLPGVTDDRVASAGQHPVPSSLAPAWQKALEAHGEITAAFESFLTTMSQDAFLQLSQSEAVASQAVAEAEAVMASEYGVGSEAMAAVRSAAVTEMERAFEDFSSFMDGE